MRKLLLFIILFCLSSSAISAVHSSRNTLSYTFHDYVEHVITTNPIQANQPVYSWRTHTKFNGDSGPLSYDGDYIGDTNSKGQLVISAPHLPMNPIYCGYFTGERVAVGSRNAPKSNVLNFMITAGVLPGPLPPWIHQCGPKGSIDKNNK